MHFSFFPLIFPGLWHLQTWMMWAADHMQYSPSYSHRWEHNINIIYSTLCWFLGSAKNKSAKPIWRRSRPVWVAAPLFWPVFCFCLFHRPSSTLTCRVKLSARFILLTWQEGKLYYLTCLERRMLFLINQSGSRLFRDSCPWHFCSCFILLLMYCFFQLKNITMLGIIVSFHCQK